MSFFVKDEEDGNLRYVKGGTAGRPCRRRLDVMGFPYGGCLQSVEEEEAEEVNMFPFFICVI